ncbi:transporter substrate-binding domain-containing protein [Azospirillum thermophilum]|uniref:transporter substrate-binding domain-containing protein n=1 Tax=Azospirillum thermophilum TaxID=2202148 RepID=UPI002481B11A|nr:transporter substrate-binding domain-containing protein [Azospirillum thermophilum]
MALALGAAPASARTVTILAPELPPMMTAEGKGHEAAIIGETLEACGHTASFRVVPFGRHWIDFRDGAQAGAAADAVTTVPTGMELPGARSVPYIRYQNGASVLKRSRLSVASLADLAGKRVVTFAGALDVLPGLREAVPGFADFRERSDQLVHSNLLFAGRVDAVLADGLIFAEHNRLLLAKAEMGGTLPFDPRQEVVFAAIFPPTPYTMMFRDAALRDAFDRCFSDLEKKGRIDEINRAAVEPYRATVRNQYLRY